MKIASPWRCDGPGCQRAKGEGNKWLLIYAGEDYRMAIWNEEQAQEDDVLHICSAECAGKIQSQWIAKINQK